MDQKILIVEDNELNMKLFHDLLEAYGYTTVRTQDGREALELARKHRPDLIVLDIQLPEISGLEVTRRLKDDDELKAHAWLEYNGTPIGEDISDEYNVFAELN